LLIRGLGDHQHGPPLWPEPVGHTPGRGGAARPCVDAPSGARRIFRQGLTRDRVLPCVRPLLRRYVVAAGPYGSSRVRSTSLERARSAPRAPGSPDPAYRHCAIPVLRPSHLADSLTAADRSRGDGWSSVDPALGHQGPGHTGVLVRQGDDHQHRRLAREHARQPGAGRDAFALGPAHDRAGRKDQ